MKIWQKYSSIVRHESPFLFYNHMYHYHVFTHNFTHPYCTYCKPHLSAHTRVSVWINTAIKSTRRENNERDDETTGLKVKAVQLQKINVPVKTVVKTSLYHTHTKLTNMWHNNSSHTNQHTNIQSQNALRRAQRKINPWETSMIKITQYWPLPIYIKIAHNSCVLSCVLVC